MSLLYILLVILIVAALLWVVNEFVVLPPRAKPVINLVIVVVLAIWVLYALGAGDVLSNARSRP